MTYETLIKSGRIKAYRASPIEIQRLLDIANRDLKASIRNQIVDPDWAYSMVYNAILQACRALMFKEGYRPRGLSQHAIVVEFTREKLGGSHSMYVSLFDQMRRKRHRAIYELTGVVSLTEIEQVITSAQEFINILKKHITMGD